MKRLRLSQMILGSSSKLRFFEMTVECSLWYGEIEPTDLHHDPQKPPNSPHCLMSLLFSVCVMVKAAAELS